jgi:hypothetical protein
LSRQLPPLHRYLLSLAAALIAIGAAPGPGNGPDRGVFPRSSSDPAEAAAVSGGLVTPDLAMGLPAFDAQRPAEGRNFTEQAKLARARAAVAAARANAAGAVSAKPSGPPAAAMPLEPDPAACLLTTPPPRQETGAPGLTPAEQAKRDQGNRDQEKGPQTNGAGPARGGRP